MKLISASSLKEMLSDGGEVALIDVREHGQYGEGHPFFGVNLPYSRIEQLAPDLMPCLGVRCVILDDADRLADRAAMVLAKMGYSKIHVLMGGAPGWQAAGYTLFKGVNVPSKAFGELVEHELGTVSVSPDEFQAMRKSNSNLLLLDGRTATEFAKMTLPGALSCPNAELGYRLPQLVRDDETTVVISCAGRTRSIIGAQTLRILGVSNPVYALRNGTQGWRLAGLHLVLGAEPSSLPEPDASNLEAARTKAAQLIADYRLHSVKSETVKDWLVDPQCSTYLFDVRTENEFAAGHLSGSRSAPGGQLVQATDEKLAVRNARIVLCCDTGLRSATTAIWLSGMGHQVWILDADASCGAETGVAKEAPAITDTIELVSLKDRLETGAILLDGSNGMLYRTGHIAGARWVTRARLDRLELNQDADIIVTGQCRDLLAGIASDLRAEGHQRVDVVRGTPDEWRSAGLEVVATLDTPSENDCIDYLFFVHDRHDGNLEAAQRYLEWETGLLEQLDDQEGGALTPLHPRHELEDAAHAT